MTASNHPFEMSPQDYQGTGVPEESIGFILQRGGEEIALEKVANRFTVRLLPEVSPEQWPSQIPFPHYRLPQVQLDEVIVEPDQLEAAMQQARDLDAVDFVGHVYQSQSDPTSLIYLTSQITIQFDRSVTSETIEAIASSLGLRKSGVIAEIPNTYIYEVTSEATENPLKIANRLTRRPEVLLAEPNIIVPAQKSYRPSDTHYHQQWYLQHNGGEQLATNSHISVEQAWDITKGLRSIIVAIADDSIDLNHPDFQGFGKIVAPLDLKDRDNLPMPVAASDNHGTACAGIAVASENGQGIVGVAPGCALMPIRTSGYLDDELIEQIFNWAIERDAAIISCSWGASSVYFPLSLRQSAVITKAATKGRNGKGCVIIFAAGNANRPINGTVDEKGWYRNLVQGETKWLNGFAIHPDAITVSACTSLNQKSAYSNWGNGISVCAPSNNAHPGISMRNIGYIYTTPIISQPLPGLGIFTSDRVGAAGYQEDDFTGNFGGTSSATPIVAGVAALVLSVNPDLTATEVKVILQDTADKIVDVNADPQLGNSFGGYDRQGYSLWFGYGKVNAFKAVGLAQRLRRIPQSVSRRIQAENRESIVIDEYNSTGVNSGILISEFGEVRDIQVGVEIEHGFLGDIEIYLIAPTGNKVLLQNRTLGCRKNLQTVYSLKTVPLLEQFMNLPIQGKWELVIVDYARFDSGILKNWQLNLGV